MTDTTIKKKPISLTEEQVGMVAEAAAWIAVSEVDTTIEEVGQLVIQTVRGMMLTGDRTIPSVDAIVADALGELRASRLADLIAESCGRILGKTVEVDDIPSMHGIDPATLAAIVTVAAVADGGDVAGIEIQPDAAIFEIACAIIGQPTG